MTFKWMAALKIGYKVLHEAGKAGVKIKGVPISEIESKIGTIVTTGSTLVDEFKKK